MSLSTTFTNLLTGSSTPFLASGDVVAFVDISDHTQSINGSTVKGTLTQFFAQLPVPVAIASASATALTVGLNGATNPAWAVDASTALQVAGLKLTGAVTGGTVALVVTDSGAAANLTVNAKGTGTIGIGSVSTGRVTITPVTTITGALTLSAALTYGGVTLSNAVTGTGNMVLSAGSTLTGTTATSALTAAGLITANLGVTVASGQTLTVSGATITGLTAASVGTGTFPGVYTVTGALTLSAALTVTGQVGIGAAPATGYKINTVIASGDLTSTTQVGHAIDLTGSSAATTDIRGIQIQVRTVAAAFTATTVSGIQVLTPIKGAGSTITTAIGLRIDPITVGATNYAIYTDGGLHRFGDAVTISQNGFNVLSGTSTIQQLVATTGVFSSTLTPQALVDISGAAAGQIQFPAVQNPSVGANTLDDYEEGTWTPSLGGSATYTTQVGTYTKVGRLVTIKCFLVVNAIGSGSTTTVSGIPFTSANDGCYNSGVVALWAGLALSPIFLAAGIGPNGSAVNFNGTTAAAASTTNTMAIFGNSAQVRFTLTYEV